jgi:tetratricopeptide (TPR) repeat protein
VRRTAPYLALLVPVLFVPTGCTHTTKDVHYVVPPSAVQTTMRRQVVNAVDLGEGDPEIRRLRRKVATDPNNLENRIALARLYERAGYTELALDHYRFARHMGNDSPTLALDEAAALNRLELHQEAIDTLRSYVAKHPDSSAALYSKLGNLLDQQGEYAAAEPYHRQAVTLEPASDRLHNNLGYNLLLQKKHEAAAEEFRAALRIAPWSETARNNLGLALTGKPGEAGAKEALAHWASVSSPAAAHNNLAAVYLDQGKYKEARQELGLALDYDRNYLPALRNLQLVAELDGGLAMAALPSQDSSWKRFAAGVKRTFVTTTENPTRARAKHGGQIASR